jgi:hypothetical protein
MKREVRNTIKRLAGKTLSISLFLLITLSSAPVIVSAQVAPIEAPPLISYDIGKTAEEEVTLSVKEALVFGLTQSLALSMLNLMQFAANRLAYDAAIIVSSGGNADQPLFEARPWSDYVLYVGAEVAAGVVNELAAAENKNQVEKNKNRDDDDQRSTASGFGPLEGFSVCTPPGLPAISIGIQSAYKQPNLEFCGVRELTTNWEQFIASASKTISDPDERRAVLLKTVKESFEPAVNPLTVSIGLYTDTLVYAEEQKKLAFLGLSEKRGFNDVVDFITGTTKTPAAYIEENAWVTREIQAASPFWAGASVLADPNVLGAVAYQAGSVFTNTLLSEWTKKIQEGFFDAPEFPDPFDAFGTATGGGREAAETRFKSLLAFQPIEVTNFSLVSEFATCPSTVRGASRRINNCVMDASFASVIARAETGVPLTLQEAINEGLIHGEWPLIPPSDLTENQDTECYTYGFCATNLIKLRKARIISAGWEIAASSKGNTSGGELATLQEVIDGFNDCNGEEGLDDAHPWCHLIDPNWVVKYPDTQCRLLVNGQQIQAAGVDARVQECVDYRSCVSESDDGTCEGDFGYCVREENTWRFRGDSCPAQFASCLTYRRDDGQVRNLLSSSVDQGGCSASNAGCRWYQTKKVENDETFDFPDIPDLVSADTREGAHENRIYFTSAVEGCEEDDAGCSELITRTDDLRLNLISNSSFEEDVDLDGLPDSWHTPYGTGGGVESDYDLTGEFSRSGDRAIRPNTVQYVQSGIQLAQNSFYTLSVYARQDPVDAGEVADLRLDVYDDRGDAIDFEFTSRTDGCTAGAFDNSMGIEGEPVGDAYQRFECTFTTPRSGTQGAPLDAFLFLDNGAFIDDIQLEQAGQVSDYHEAYNLSDAQLDYSYAKLPPTYLGCTGAPDDHPDCGNYAKICSESDQGCSAYTPTNGDPIIHAVAAPGDICDDVCSGYDTYKQEATRYEPSGAFPVYLIPETGAICSASAVGCDEFTNLTNEALEYYTYLRTCVTEAQAATNINGDNEGIYYTWEGSDVAGYQLRTWHLLNTDVNRTSSVAFDSGFVEDRPDFAPCTNYYSDEDGVHCSDAADLVFEEKEACDEHDDIFDNPDCREFYDAEGNIHYRDWRDTVSVDNACISYRKTNVFGLGEDVSPADGRDDGEVNCVESGGRFDGDARSCLYYGLSSQSLGCSADQNGCREYTGGQSRNSRVVLNDNFESGSISEWEGGSGGGSIPKINLSNDSIAADGHSLQSNGFALDTHAYSTFAPCEDPEGCLSPVSEFGATCLVEEGGYGCGILDDQIFPGRTYTISFLAKGDAEIAVDIFDEVALNVDPLLLLDRESWVHAFTGSLAITNEWKRYTLGPIVIPEDSEWITEGAKLSFSDVGVGNTFNIDNVVLREGEQDIFLINDSWNTPAQCDQNNAGASAPQFQLGCQEYTDQNGDFNYLKSFTRLCGEGQVGCAGYYKTNQSEETYAQAYNGTCSNLDFDGDGDLTVDTLTACRVFLNADETDFLSESQKLCDIAPGASSCQFDSDFWLPQIGPIGVLTSGHVSYGPDVEVVGQDQSIYAIIDREDRCDSASGGCREVGLPTFTQDRSAVESWTTTYLRNDPARYEETLCRNDELFCAAWSSTLKGQWYFKDPDNHACEYKTNVSIGASQYDGWFRTGTTDFCYGSCSIGGDSCSIDADCSPGGGTCDPTIGSYVISGDTSGLWLNGDLNYDGWAGECAAEWDGCSEYQDPLDIGEDEFYTEEIGERFHFIDNNNLDENTLPTAQQCKGQVSQELGCVLFNDTSDVKLTYNASATITASKNADVLFGGEKFDLVDPIDCDTPGAGIITKQDGSEFDLCNNRCRYNTVDLKGYVLPFDPDYRFGESCVTDADCKVIPSNLAGEFVQGICRDVENPFRNLQNDTNRILKVNRDRQCSEWINCARSRQIWDEATATWRSICLEIALHEDGSDGAEFREVEIDSQAAILDIARYSSRDIGWYGDDYAGYAIPEMYPVEHLSQENIEPIYICSRNKDACRPEDGCAVGAGSCDRNENEEFRLAFNGGECAAGTDFGDVCSIGYCSGTGSTCTSNAQCGEAEQCTTGLCLTRTGDACIVNEDCNEGGGERCFEGDCVIDQGFCGIDNSCGAGTCSVSAAVKTGTCYNEACLLSPQGEPLIDNANVTEICRAYPEASSPFSANLVEQWSVNGTVSAAPSGVNAATPYDVRSGFDQANFCAPGEICDCSYNKVQGGGYTHYVDIDTRFEATKGVCTSGSGIGGLCDVDEDCVVEPVIAEVGACAQLEGEDSFYGLTGYCLEKDPGVNINGDRDERACVTWLPVDELQGTTSIYDKAVRAGVFEDYYFCGEVNPYLIAKPVKGCAAVRTAPGDNDEDPVNVTSDNNTQCKNQIVCPDGYWAVAGPARYGSKVDEGGTAANIANTQCKKSAKDGDLQLWDEGKHACPYICVPKTSFHSSTDNPDYGLKCGIPADAIKGTATRSPGLHAKTDYYFLNTYEKYNTAAPGYEDCQAYGDPASEDNYKIASDDKRVPPSANLNRSGDHDYRLDDNIINPSSVDIDELLETYAACKSIIKVSAQDTGDGYGIAWTNRILGGGEGHSVDDLDYVKDTALAAFGRSISPATASNPRIDIPFHSPAIVTSCVARNADPFGKALSPTLSPDVDDCPVLSHKSQVVNEEPEARSYVDWVTTYSTLGDMVLGVGEGFETIKERLQELFAVSSQLVFEWDSQVSGPGDLDRSPSEGVGEYGEGEPVSTYNGKVFEWDNRAADPEPPQVYAIDSAKCLDSGICEEDPDHSLTINGKNSGDIEGSEGFLSVNLSFYAFADANHLPLRVVEPAWGEGNGVLDAKGPDGENFYVNHRGLTSYPQEATKCDSEDGEWGRTPESCDPHYFNYDNDYVCSPDIIEDLPVCGGDLPSLTQSCQKDERECRFKVGVHVRDNWGYCAGNCGIEGEGCFDTFGDISPANRDSQCNYERFPEFNPDIDPWVYYDGQIVVGL